MAACERARERDSKTEKGRESRDRAAGEIEAGEGVPAADLLTKLEVEDKGEMRVTEAADSLAPRLAAAILEERDGLSKAQSEAITGYLMELLESSIADVTERVRNVNANLPADDSYAQKVQELTAAERLTRRPVEVE